MTVDDACGQTVSLALRGLADSACLVSVGHPDYRAFRLLAFACRGVLVLITAQDGFFDPPDVLASHPNGGQFAGRKRGRGVIVRSCNPGDVSERRNRVAMATWYQLSSFV